MKKHNVKKNEIKGIINDYILELIPAGTKGVIKGNKFNSIVKDTINDMELDNDKFKIRFEKKCHNCQTGEIPDWYILDKKSKKVIIGMNQLDFWTGGHQSNRGSNYLIGNKINTDNSKLLCVICNEQKFTSDSSKTFEFFNIGFKNNTLCYLNGLEQIINEYFE